MKRKHSESLENQISDALRYSEENPEVSVATVAREFGITRGVLRSRLSGAQRQPVNPSLSTKLTHSEEKALCRYIDRLDSVNLETRREYVVDTANSILKARLGKSDTAEPLTVGRHWITRFLNRHGYHLSKRKQLEKNRQTAESPKIIQLWFDKLKEIILEYGVNPDDIYNMDETGFQIGVGKDQMVITKKKRQSYFGMPINRESATLVEAIRGNGEVIPPFIILSGTVHLTKWYTIPSLHPRTTISVSPTGYSNDELTIAWIKHFEDRTASRTIGGWRLLILDGYGSHKTKEFIDFCEEKHIIPFGLPPHITHILQPLDVVCFQPLKHYHAKALDVIVRDGCTSIDKVNYPSLPHYHLLSILYRLNSLI